MPSASIRPPALVRSQSSWSIAGAHYKHWATSLGNFGVTPFFWREPHTVTVTTVRSQIFIWRIIRTVTSIKPGVKIYYGWRQYGWDLDDGRRRRSVVKINKGLQDLIVKIYQIGIVWVRKTAVLYETMMMITLITFNPKNCPTTLPTYRVCVVLFYSSEKYTLYTVVSLCTL